jgi:transcription elongation factor GreA
MGRPMTPRGYNMLREELKKLKAQRPENAKALALARAHGDLSENADYDAAKNKLGLTEARIRDVEAALSQAELIDPAQISDPKKVVFGASVKLLDINSEESKTVSIYGTEESDVNRG